MSLRALVLSCAISCGLVTSAEANTTLPADLNTLTSEAFAIAYGRVVDVRARSSGDGVRIETLVTLEVGSYLKGDLGDEVTFRVPGGTLGRYRSLVVGAPQFEPGQEVVLFIGARPPAFPYVVRLGQGVFPVTVDAQTGARSVARLPRLTGADARPVSRGSAENRPMSLAAFSALVRSVMETGR